MAKHRSRWKRSQALSKKSFTVQLQLAVPGVPTDAGEAFHELYIETGRHVLPAMMESDGETLCRTKGRHLGERRCLVHLPNQYRYLARVWQSRESA